MLVLLQNGANIPSEPAPIALSQAAKLYIEYKKELKLGRSPAAAFASSPAQQGQAASSTGIRHEARRMSPSQRTT